MIAATYTQGASFAVTDIPAPEVAPDEILLRVEASSICGTDTKIMRAGHRKLRNAQRVTLGHELAGTIAKTGADVRGYAEGARIGIAPNWGCGRCEACVRGQANYCAGYSAFGINYDGAHTGFLRVPAAVIAQGNIVPLPDDLPWELASLAEPLSCVINAQKAMPVRAGDTVAVYGCGPMGLLHILLAVANGAAKVIAIDTSPERVQAARDLGATDGVCSTAENTPDRVRALTGGRGVDAVITAAPVAAIAIEGLGLLAPFGRLCLFAGLPKDAPQVSLDGNAIHYKNLHVTGTTGGCNEDYRLALRLIHSGRVPVGKIISHRFPLSRLQEAYDTAVSGKALKVVILADPS